MLWLDDAQWGADALGFADYLLETQEHHELPILIVLTVRDDALEQRESERAIYFDLVERDDARTLAVEPLDRGESRTLIGELLGLESRLAAEVAARVGGNPLFAVQLIGDWVQRGLLVPGPHGFDLRAGQSAELPDDIHALWSARIDQVLAEAGESSSVSLELAAILGGEVELGEWQAVCELTGAQANEALVDALLSRRLAVGGVDRWSFTHAMLRESVERRAFEGGRLEDHHRTCAMVLFPGCGTHARRARAPGTTPHRRRGARRGPSRLARRGARGHVDR